MSFHTPIQSSDWVTHFSFGSCDSCVNFNSKKVSRISWSLSKYRLVIPLRVQKMCSSWWVCFYRRLLLIQAQVMNIPTNVVIFTGWPSNIHVFYVVSFSFFQQNMLQMDAVAKENKSLKKKIHQLEKALGQRGIKEIFSLECFYNFKL